jgi:hypothetical protein
MITGNNNKRIVICADGTWNRPEKNLKGVGSYYDQVIDKQSDHLITAWRFSNAAPGFSRLHFL